MDKLKFFLKFGSIFALILAYIAVSVIILIFSKPTSRRRNLCFNRSYFTRMALKLLGIRIVKKSNFQPVGKTYLIVSNHLSYTDVVVISSIFPACFVTSVEIAKDFFLGTLARMGGSLFVERRKKTRLLRDLETVSSVLSDGLSVVLFPEGTSTNGESILPFKKTLFRSAISCGVDVLPVCVCYVSINGKSVNEENRDLVFWYGDMRFFPHFMNFLRIHSIEVSLEILPPIQTSSMNSDTISKLAYHSIYQAYQKKCHW
ncbi:MAG: 1-acyl-sn-glycerol-3-phosphate acyltransferase [Candidatus Omnitrophica bacterium]|nr:1-acyl-sn-glycerol-3-phosphate acyltransferase [Candidatus Omnitrophota bacterium]MCM8828961.1 1-acyl-sn-glycerol-3-phosphate acyltransferase [Candidatus Omnitrophota bacterium]